MVGLRLAGPRGACLHYDAGVRPLVQVALRLFHQLADEQHRRGRAIPAGGRDDQLQRGRSACMGWRRVA